MIRRHLRESARSHADIEDEPALELRRAEADLRGERVVRVRSAAQGVDLGPAMQRPLETEGLGVGLGRDEPRDPVDDGVGVASRARESLGLFEERRPAFGAQEGQVSPAQRRLQSALAGRQGATSEAAYKVGLATSDPRSHRAARSARTRS